jgi:hypothetical protein
MNQRFLPTVSRRFANVSSAGVLRQLGASVPFGWLALTRQRRRSPNYAAIAVASAAVGAIAALLLAPSTGRDLRSRLGSAGKTAGGSLGGQLGKLFGKQVGAHPVQTARVAGAVREAFGTNEH